MRPGPKPKRLVDVQWRPELAYAIGLLVSDGSLSKNGRHIDFTSKDVALIKVFQSCLGISHITIGTKKSGSSHKKQYYRVQFGDVHFHQWLRDIGVTPDKSKTVAAVTIPDIFFFDFVRGIFDGDGTIYQSIDNRWKNSTVISLGFASGSEAFLKWLKKRLTESLEVTGFISQGARVNQLRYGKSDTVKIYSAMYHDSNCPKLDRKFAKMQKILRIDTPYR